MLRLAPGASDDQTEDMEPDDRLVLYIRTPRSIHDTFSTLTLALFRLMD